ncbi:serine/threonine-protein kinase, partial [Vibrio sp. 10N.222.46.A1]
SLYRDIFLDREVAIKTIPISKKNNTIEEVNLLKSIASKHVVGLYDVIQTQTNIEIYQEYLDGEDLASKVGQCHGPEFLSLAYQLASGLRDIHSSGICHRDIKLDNAKFDKQGVLKIFDFGVSRIGDPHQTVNGHGTLEYLAPEAFGLYTQDSVVLSFAVDIYALGVTLHKLAFSGICKFNKTLNPQPESPRFAELGFCSKLTSLLNKCVSENKTERPSANSLVAELQRELLRNKHTGLFVAPKGSHNIDQAHPKTRIKISDDLSIIINYNGYDFYVTKVEGHVYINNEIVDVGKVLYGACVLTFVRDANNRFFVSFSSSHPEIVL